MSDITLSDKIRCLKREIAMRERAYPKWLKAGKITLEASVHEIAAMKAVLHDYEVRVAVPDQLQPRVCKAQMVYTHLARAAIWEIGGTENANGAKPGGADRQP